MVHDAAYVPISVALLSLHFEKTALIAYANMSHITQILTVLQHALVSSSANS